MNSITFWVLILAGLFGLFSLILLIALLKVVNRITEVNKHLIILVAGKEAKPEALRALVASSKPPQGKLRGIAPDKKKDTKKPDNTNYTMEIGVK